MKTKIDKFNNGRRIRITLVLVAITTIVLMIIRKVAVDHFLNDFSLSTYFRGREHLGDSSFRIISGGEQSRDAIYEFRNLCIDRKGLFQHSLHIDIPSLISISSVSGEKEIQLILQFRPLPSKYDILSSPLFV